MSVYLIDYENVNTDGLNGISRLSAEDLVVIFYSENADRMTFGLHRRLGESKAAIDLRKVDVGGSNALDFQLCTYLGYLIGQDKARQFRIVSNDRGYEFVVGFWTRQKVEVRLVSEISEGNVRLPQPAAAAQPSAPAKPAVKQQPAAPANSAAAAKQQPAVQKPVPVVKPAAQTERAVKATPQKVVPVALAELLPDEKEAELVESYIEKYKTKQGLNNALVRKFGNARGGELYQKLKPLIADKKGC